MRWRRRKEIERGRPWEDDHKRTDADYMRASGGSGSLDLYFGDRGQPLLVFAHLPKTAGTALRNIIHTNLGDSGWEVVEIPRMKGHKAELEAWYENLYASLGERSGQLVCAASHTAQYLPAVVSNREVRSFTILRDPVDRALSRYYFLATQEVTIEGLYEGIETNKTKNGRVSSKESEFANGQSRRLLAPHHDTFALPRMSSDQDAELWRERLFGIVEETYLVGLQDRFAESVQFFAGEFGWPKPYEAAAKVNRRRPSLAEVPEKTKELIRAYNWLDDDLYRAWSARFDETLRLSGDRGRSPAASTTTE